jgi:hypothetical protein
MARMSQYQLLATVFSSAAVQPSLSGGVPVFVHALGAMCPVTALEAATRTNSACLKATALNSVARLSDVPRNYVPSPLCTFDGRVV